MPLAEGLAQESYLFDLTLRLPGANDRMREFLAQGGQTREVEVRVADHLGPRT